MRRASLILQLLADVCLLPLSAQKGYTMDEALEFFKLKTELVKNELGRQPILTKRRVRKALLNRIESTG